MYRSTRNIYKSYVVVLGILAILIISLAEAVLPISNKISNIMVKNALAQLPNSTTNNTTTSSTNATGYLTYKDSKGRFTIDYPSGWKVTPAKNRFEPYAVEFSSPDLLSRLDVRLNKINFFGDIETIMSGSPDRLRFSTPNFELNQDVECQKYTINGNKACSMIFTQTPDYISDVKIAFMDVATIIKGTTYMLVYGSTPDDFDSNLLIIDKMISSFRIPANATGAA